MKQFIWSVTSRITRHDEEFLDKYLNCEERALFNRLSLNEQKHSIRVAENVKKVLEDKGYGREELGFDEINMMKASLLHDIGKTCAKMNVIEKSIIVILDKITSGQLKDMVHSNKINCYYNHGRIGCDILGKLGYDEKFLNLIRDHHLRDCKKNKALEILIYCDEKN